GQISATGLSVIGVASQGDGLTYTVTLVKDLRSAITEGTVWVEEGAVQDVAGNPNQGSEVLRISFGPSSRAAAAAALGARLVSRGLVTTTGISLAALLPTVLLQTSDLLGAWAGGIPSAAPGAFTPRFATRGNLLGIIGTVQTFALFRKLAIRQSAAFQEVIGSLATMNLESRPMTSLEVAYAAAPAPAPWASIAGFRRRLLQNGTGTGTPDPASVSTSRAEGWHTSGLIFGRALIVLSATSVVRTALAYVWKRIFNQSLPDLLLFPRAELQAGAFCFYPVSIACASLLQGQSTAQAFVGALLLLLIPCSAIIAVLGFLATHVILGSEAYFEPSRGSPKALTWRGRAVAACFGVPCAGRWTDARRTHGRPVERFGLLFESVRPPVCNGRKSLFKRETSAAENDTNGRPQISNASERSGADIGRIEGSESGGKRIERPGLSEMGGQSSRRMKPLLLGAGLGWPVADGARALVRMLRTCHVGAIFTKRLVFAALLAARERHVAGSEPGLSQVGLSLTTSAAFLSWLLIAKPYVSQALQGVEMATGFVEVFTLSLALQSGRVERKAFQRGTAGTGSLTEEERKLGAGMLGLQIVAVGVQTGYQWWAAIVGLRAHWKMWKERREVQAEKRRSSEMLRKSENHLTSNRGRDRGPRDLQSVSGDKEGRGAKRERGEDEVRERMSAEEAPTRTERGARGGAALRVSKARRRNKRKVITSSSAKHETEFDDNWGHVASDVDLALTQWLEEDLENKSGILSGSERVTGNGMSSSRGFVRKEAELGVFAAQTKTVRTAEVRESASQEARAARGDRKERSRNGETERKQGRTGRSADSGASEISEVLSAGSGGGRKAKSRKASQQSDRPKRASSDASTRRREGSGKVRSLSPHSGGQDLVSRPLSEGIREVPMRASESGNKSTRAARLGRLKSRRKVTATATMTYFVVSESDESEASDGEDRTAGVNVRPALRRNMVASFTFKTEAEGVGRDW
ncbi:hypothetical protein KFL_010280020, partial [Klebsormidium nitens]